MTALSHGRLRVLLCDADDCLFPSEEPAYEASAHVTNAFLGEAGVPERWTAGELRRRYTGLNFRATLPLLATRYGVQLTDTDLDRWVEREATEVTAHLARTLTSDGDVLEPLRRLSEALRLAVVSSSASRRIDACLRATGLAPLFAPHDRFSAEDSLPHPRSKPAPAVYRHAVQTLRAGPGEALAVEDSEVGVRSAVGAGVPVVGLVQFLEGDERVRRSEALLRAGACTVVESWSDLVGLCRTKPRIGSVRTDDDTPTGVSRQQVKQRPAATSTRSHP